MTSTYLNGSWADFPYQLMEAVSKLIIKEISGISRITYDTSGKPRATIKGGY